MIKTDIVDKTTITYMFYNDDKYNQEIKALETKSEMGTLTLGFIKFGRNFIHPYSQILKIKGFKEGFIIIVIAKKQNQQQLVGKIIVALKDIILNQKQVKTAYLFDLRIDSKMQRLGIAKNLIDISIKQSKERGATFMYCSTNWKTIPNSQKAINFFEKKMNFKIISERNFMFSEFSKRKQIVLKKKLKNGQMSFYQFRKNTQKYQIELKKFDMRLKNVKEIFQNNAKYLGCCTLQTKNSFAALSLFKDQLDFSLTLQRYYFSKQAWKNGLFQKFIIGSTIILVSVLFYIIYKQKKKRLFSTIATGIYGFLVYVMNKVQQVYQMNNYVQNFIHNSGRIVNPVFRGVKEEQDELMEILINNARAQAAKNNCPVCRINIQIRDPTIVHFRKHTGFMMEQLFMTTRSVFFYCDLYQGKREIERNQFIFFDPRDI